MYTREYSVKLIGHTGVGKSTLLATMVGQDIFPRQAGEVVTAVPTHVRFCAKQDQEEKAFIVASSQHYIKKEVREFLAKDSINKLILPIQWFVVVVEITLVIRFFFKLFGAAPDNPSVGFLYALTDVVVFVFSTIFRPMVIHPDNVLEWST